MSNSATRALVLCWVEVYLLHVPRIDNLPSITSRFVTMTYVILLKTMMMRKIVYIQQRTSVIIMLNIFISDECERHLEFKETFIGQRLINHVIRIAHIMDYEFCGVLCYMEPNCASYNLMKTSENGKHRCEINNATHEEHEEDLEKNSNYEYHAAKVRASQKSDYNRPRAIYKYINMAPRLSGQTPIWDCFQSIQVSFGT